MCNIKGQENNNKLKKKKAAEQVNASSILFIYIPPDL